MYVICTIGAFNVLYCSLISRKGCSVAFHLAGGFYANAEPKPRLLAQCISLCGSESSVPGVSVSVYLVT